MEAYSEFQDLENLCTSTKDIIQNGNKDSWSYIWGNDSFTVKEAYKALAILVLHLLSSNGFGNLAAKQSINSSSGSFFMID
jgi:hypothetical protein